MQPLAPLVERQADVLRKLALIAPVYPAFFALQSSLGAAS